VGVSAEGTRPRTGAVNTTALERSSAVRCHHLLKTFWGWQDKQLPDRHGDVDDAWRATVCSVTSIRRGPRGDVVNNASLLDAYRTNWPRVGAVLGMALGGASTLAAGKRLSNLRALSVMNFIALLAH